MNDRKKFLLKELYNTYKYDSEWGTVLELEELKELDSLLEEIFDKLKVKGTHQEQD